MQQAKRLCKCVANSYKAKETTLLTYSLTIFRLRTISSPLIVAILHASSRWQGQWLKYLFFGVNNTHILHDTSYAWANTKHIHVMLILRVDIDSNLYEFSSSSYQFSESLKCHNCSEWFCSDVFCGRIICSQIHFLGPSRSYMIVQLPASVKLEGPLFTSMDQTRRISHPSVT